MEICPSAPEKPSGDLNPAPRPMVPEAGGHRVPHGGHITADTWRSRLFGRALSHRVAAAVWICAPRCGGSRAGSARAGDAGLQPVHELRAWRAATAAVRRASEARCVEWDPDGDLTVGLQLRATGVAA